MHSLPLAYFFIKLDHVTCLSLTFEIEKKATMKLAKYHKLIGLLLA